MSKNKSKSPSPMEEQAKQSNFAGMRKMKEVDILKEAGLSVHTEPIKRVKKL